MTKLQWDQTGERKYETGVDRGVLYKRAANGTYPLGVPWNGLVSISESPSGAESNKQYADNIVYLNLISAEEFGATIEAFTYPDEWEECDGSKEPVPGLSIGQQARATFGLSYRTLIGNDVEAAGEYGEKTHLVWGALAGVSEKARTTVNESPEALTFSWEISTTPVAIGEGFKPSAKFTADSTKLPAAQYKALLDILHGTAGTDPRLPSPAEVIALFQGAAPVEVEPLEPTYNATTKTITIPTRTGVVYQIDGETVTGAVVITEDTLVKAKPAAGYKFPEVTDEDWLYEF